MYERPLCPVLVDSRRVPIGLPASACGGERPANACSLRPLERCSTLERQRRSQCHGRHRARAIPGESPSFRRRSVVFVMLSCHAASDVTSVITLTGPRPGIKPYRAERFSRMATQGLGLSPGVPLVFDSTHRLARGRPVHAHVLPVRRGCRKQVAPCWRRILGRTIEKQTPRMTLNRAEAPSEL